MNTEVKTPIVPPLYADKDEKCSVCEIYVTDGQYVYDKQNLFDVETNNVILEVVAAEAGTINSIEIKLGQRVEPETVVMKINTANKEPFDKKMLRKINIEFLSGLMLGSLFTYAVMKFIQSQ